jgi:NitT/TauT family transport system substrate-binding protein
MHQEDCRMRFVRGIAAALGAVLWVMPGAAQTPQKFTFALNWYAVGDHAAYWVALDKGYFAKAGLDVALETSKGSGDAIAKVDTGRADAGLADSAVVIAALARDARIKIVGMVFDKTPLNVFSRRESAVLRPKDLEGKTLAAPPGDSQRQIWPAFARINGVDAGKVTWVNVEPAAKIAALAEKRVDAVADYTTGLPYYEKAMGEGSVAMLPWADFGLDMYSISIVASDRTMTEKPAQLRAFLEAAYSGWRDVMADPKEALAIFKRRVPEIDQAIIAANMRLGLALMKTQRYAQNGIGWMDREKMCASVDLVNAYMGLPRKVACDGVFSNAFLSRIVPPKGAD